MVGCQQYTEELLAQKEFEFLYILEQQEGNYQESKSDFIKREYKKARSRGEKCHARSMMQNGAERLAGVLGQCPALVQLNVYGNWIDAGETERLEGVLPQWSRRGG